MVDLGVVMPVYIQKPEYLSAALNSLLTQTLKEYRCIIVIDGAPEMEPLVKAIVGDDPRVEIIRHDRNQGVAKALNTGFRKLFKDKRLKYLTWVSSDNIYNPMFLQILREALVKGPAELGIVYSSFNSIDNNGNLLHDEHQLAIQRQYQSQTKAKLLDSSIIGVSFMYKSCYAQLIDGYSLEPVEDYDYWLRLTEHCEIKYIPVELIDYRVNSTFSVSARLQSIEEHRKWRYAYHLARYSARTRRNIQPELTILIPLEEVDEATVARIENLYEQTFSNYVCYVLDLSEGEQVSAIVSSIPHPSTAFKWLPNLDEVSAILYTAQMVYTPFSMILNLQPFPDVMDLQILVNELKKAGPNVFSNYYTEDHTDVEYRYADSAARKADIYNELFRSNGLVELFKEYTRKTSESK